MKMKRKDRRGRQWTLNDSGLLRGRETQHRTQVPLYEDYTPANDMGGAIHIFLHPRGFFSQSLKGYAFLCLLVEDCDGKVCRRIGLLCVQFPHGSLPFDLNLDV